jgi:hypothetical protein
MLAGILVLSTYYERRMAKFAGAMSWRRILEFRLREHFTLLGQIGGC